MAEDVTTPEATEDRELAIQPIPSLFTKYSLITLQGMVAQIIMVIVEGVIMGAGLGAHGLACVSIIITVELINLAPAVRIVVALCALGYTGQMMSSYFECVELIGEAIVTGIALYVIFTIPLVFVMGAVMGVSGVWWAQLVAHIGAGVLSIVLAQRELRRLRSLG